MEKKNWWDKVMDEDFKKDVRKKVLDVLRATELKGQPPLEEMFTDVYAEIPPHLEEQRQSLLEHVKKYPDHYFGDSHH